MDSIRRGVAPLVAVILWSVAGVASAAQVSPPQKIQELNKLTGAEAMSGALKAMIDDKDGTKALIDAAFPIAKEKKDALSYNGALVLALATAETKDVARSEAFFRVCMDKAAKLQSTNKILQSYGGLIELYFGNKKYKESERICRELLELKTDDGKPRIVLVAYTTRLGQDDFNEEDGFDAAKEIRPGVHRLLIQAVMMQGNYDQALKLADNLLKATDRWQELQLKGEILREAGKYAEAAKIYGEVIGRVTKDKALDPEVKEVRLDRFRYTLSNIYVEMKQIDKASEELLQLLAKRPDHPGYNNDLGYIWADNDMKLDEAEKLIRKALDLDRKRRKADPKLEPEDDIDNGAYLDSLGWVLFKKKQYQEAKKVLLEAVKDKSSQHIEIYDHLGDVHLVLGEKTEALAAWREGLKHAGEGRREQERKAVVEKKIEQHK